MDLADIHDFDPSRVRNAMISKGGQVSIPAEVRRRWRTDRVRLVDLGDRLIVRPVAVRRHRRRQGGAAAASRPHRRGPPRRRTRRGRRRRGPPVILDAYAVIAYLAGERAADEVEQLLRSIDDRPRITAVNAGEVVDRLTRAAGLDLGRVLDELRGLRDGGVEILAVDAFDGMCAGSLRQKFYDRRTAPLSLADCIALTAALRYRQPLATADPALATAAPQHGPRRRRAPQLVGRPPDVGEASRGCAGDRRILGGVAKVLDRPVLFYDDL